MYFFKIRAARTWLKLTIFKMNSPVKNVLNSFCCCIYTTLPPRSRRHCHALATPVQHQQLCPVPTNNKMCVFPLPIFVSKWGGEPGRPSLSMRRCRTDPWRERALARRDNRPSQQADGSTGRGRERGPRWVDDPATTEQICSSRSSWADPCKRDPVRGYRLSRIRRPSSSRHLVGSNRDLNST